MANQQLVEYIKQQLQQGTSREQITVTLTANGWSDSDVSEAFNFISSPAPAPSPLAPQVPMPAQQAVQQPVLSSLPSAAAILSQAWTLYKQRLGTFLGVTIIPTLLLAGFSVVLAGVGYLGFIMMLASKSIAGSTGLIAVLLAVILFLIMSIIQAWGQTALLYAIKDSQEKIGVMTAYRRGWHKILPYYWISILAGLITIGGFILFIVPGIVFMGWFSLTMFIVIAEDLWGMDALLKSKEYVRDIWDSVAWRFIFIGGSPYPAALPRVPCRKAQETSVS